ncbi:MAG TPA: hypothetical protein VMV18_00845, partial [bacterium]|nr:hypothetical protein [bacterium]
DAHKQFALELDAAAAAFASKNLPGAALVTELRALQHDPMQTSAFNRAGDLRKSLLSKSAVSIPSVTMNDQGWWSFGVALTPRLERHLGEYPPYGPTKNAAAAIPASFVVTIEDFSWADSTTHTLEAHTDKNGGSSGKGKVPNPKHAAQAKLVDDLTRELKYMEAGAIMQGDRKSPWITTGGAATPTPAPAATPAASGKKGASAPTATASAATARKPLTARPATADEIAKKKDELAAAQKELDATPAEVNAGDDATWYVPVTETTRTVKAKVRFAVKEPDFAEPVTKELEFSISAQDKSNDADAKHSVAADPLKLTPVEQLLGDLADKFVEEGVAVMRDARQRRAERWIELAHTRHAQGQEDDALDAFVWALFTLGADDAPADARSVISTRLDGQDPKMVVAGP